MLPDRCLSFRVETHRNKLGQILKEVKNAVADRIKVNKSDIIGY